LSICVCVCACVCVCLRGGHAYLLGKVVNVGLEALDSRRIAAFAQPLQLALQLRQILRRRQGPKGSECHRERERERERERLCACARECVYVRACVCTHACACACVRDAIGRLRPHKHTYRSPSTAPACSRARSATRPAAAAWRTASSASRTSTARASAASRCKWGGRRLA
jgi:hypothetical protein